MSWRELLGCVALFVVGGLVLLYFLIAFSPPPAIPH